MDESLYAYVLRHLQQTKGSWPTVAEEAGVPFRTVEKIARREIEDPRISTVEKLADYFRRRDAGLRPTEARV